MKIFNPIMWWKTRHYRRVRKSIRYLHPDIQLGLAEGIIANMVACRPRKLRKAMLVRVGDQIAELVKQTVEKRGESKIEIVGGIK